MLEPVTTQDLLHLHNQDETPLVERLLTTVAAGERARQRDALIRAAGRAVRSRWSDLAVSKFLLGRLVVLQVNVPAFIDGTAAPDGLLSAALLWSGGNVPSLSAIRRATAGVAHEFADVSSAG